MFLKTRHTGLVVNNIDNSLRFYESMGFNLLSREVEKGEFISKVVGIANVVIETAKLMGADQSMIELIQYHSHPDLAEITDAPSNSHGCSHIAFSVADADEACNKIINLGGSKINSPEISPNGKYKVAYCHDIDGIILEIVEELE